MSESNTLVWAKPFFCHCGKEPEGDPFRLFVHRSRRMEVSFPAGGFRPTGGVEAITDTITVV